MFIQDPEPVYIAGLPGFGLSAEMENPCISHYPVHITDASTPQKVGTVIPGVIVPEIVIQFQGSGAENCI